MAGVHLEGLPLHHELVAWRARLQQSTTTAPEYRLYAPGGGLPARAGLVRVSTGGHAIEVEVYRLPRTEIGELLARVPPPLALGRVRLVSGELVTGFVCEPIGIEGAEEISGCGAWRSYVASLAYRQDE